MNGGEKIFCFTYRCRDDEGHREMGSRRVPQCQRPDRMDPRPRAQGGRKGKEQARAAPRAAAAGAAAARLSRRPTRAELRRRCLVTNKKIIGSPASVCKKNPLICNTVSNRLGKSSHHTILSGQFPAGTLRPRHHAKDRDPCFIGPSHGYAPVPGSWQIGSNQ